MTLDCLKDVVGVRDCGAGQPDTQTGHSLVYLQSLPGISVTDFDKAINNESRNALSRIDELLGLAIQEVSLDVQNALQGKYELRTFIENDVIGFFQDDKVLMPAQTGSLTGLEIRMNLTPYLKLFIRQVKLFCNYTGSVDVKIYDLVQGKLLDTVTIDAVAGQVAVVPVDLEYMNDRQRLHLFIGYESAFDSYKTLLSTFTDDGGITSSYTNSWMFFRGAKLGNSVPKLRENLYGNSGTAGLSISYSLQCSFDEHLCNIKKLLAMPILYKAGALIMKEMKYSKRLNGVITCYAQDHLELMNSYNEEYNLRMAQLFQNMNMPASSCFSCASMVEARSVLP
ncbi:MAG TPA: hypothetical protein VG603_08450 [Chitinophagales bacterium]|nr:hypothetical protein [Chitinophagales bacterium]